MNYKESYLLSHLIDPKGDDIKSFSKTMLGLYGYDFLDFLENSKHKDANSCVQSLLDKYFSKFPQLGEGKPLLQPILEKLADEGFIKIKTKKIFSDFSEISFKKRTNPKAKKGYKEIIKLFNARFERVMKSHRVKNGKYELRFFWPEGASPQVFGLFDDLFKKKHYDNKSSVDVYVLNEEGLNLKVRNKKFHLKKYLYSIPPIFCYQNKEKREIPSHFPEYDLLEVHKNRFIRQLGDRAKIEFSLIKIHDKEWKTMCIESSRLKDILALSLLINSLDGECLTYSEFLKKYAPEKT